MFIKVLKMCPFRTGQNSRTLPLFMSLWWSVLSTIDHLTIWSLIICSLPSAGTSVLQVTASDADDPTYGNSAKIVYTILEGQPYFSVDPKTGTNCFWLHFKHILPIAQGQARRGAQAAPWNMITPPISWNHHWIFIYLFFLSGRLSL